MNMVDNTKRPKVSVRIPAYNHEKYIRECLDSVLNQTFQDFEIVITDDGSTDRTVDIIKEYKDPRIKLKVFEKNQGCSVAVADCVQRSTGEYIANLCSDDAWEADKLAKQVSFLDENPQYDAVFTKVQLIDEDSNDLNYTKSAYNKIFEVENRSKEEWLNHFFNVGNCLCIPSVLIRKSVYEELGFQDKRMASLNDFDLWVRFCLKHELHILDEKLTRFRLRANEANASGDRIENHIRNRFEYKQILSNFLSIDNVDLLKRIFPDCEKYGKATKEIIPYFLGRLAYDTSDDFKQLWGLETIFELMENDEIVRLLNDNCNFSYASFHRLSAERDIYKLRIINEQVQNIQTLYREIQKNQETINQQMSHIEFLNSEIQNLLNSRSWRLTKPLRMLKTVIKRGNL